MKIKNLTHLNTVPMTINLERVRIEANVDDSDEVKLSMKKGLMVLDYIGLSIFL